MINSLSKWTEATNWFGLEESLIRDEVHSYYGGKILLVCFFIKVIFTDAGLYSLLCPESTTFLKSQKISFATGKKPWLIVAKGHNSLIHKPGKYGHGIYIYSDHNVHVL